jgi:hypothetical protein
MMTDHRPKSFKDNDLSMTTLDASGRASEKKTYCPLPATNACHDRVPLKPVFLTSLEGDGRD